MCRVRPSLAWALAATALLVALGGRVPSSMPSPMPSPMPSRGAEDDSLDLTDDLYHRIKAGLFQPNREPLVLRVTQPGKDIVGDPVPAEYLTFSSDQGSFAVRTDSRGAVVVHMELEAVLSHLTVTTLPGRGLVREFEEDPRHPIR